LPSHPRADEPVFFNPPLIFVILHELADRTTDFLDVAQDFAADGLLLESSIKPLHNPVGLGLLHEGEAGLDAPESHLIDKVVGKVLTAVIHPQ